MRPEESAGRLSAGAACAAADPARLPPDGTGGWRRVYSRAVKPSRRTALRTLAALAAAALLAPGWAGRLAPATHDEILEAASRVRGLGVSVPDPAAPDARFDLQYLGSGWAALLTSFGLRGVVPQLVPPDFAAHVPPAVGGVQRADGYHRVVTTWHWPWWRPGGGLDLTR